MSSTNQAQSDSSVLDQLKEMMKEVREVREDISKSENSTASRIDSLSKRMTDRLNKAEQGVKSLSQDMTVVKADIARVRADASRESTRIDKMIGEVVDKKLELLRPSSPTSIRRPRTPRPLTGANLIPLDTARAGDKEENYWKARRSLKMWPVEGNDLAEAALRFMEAKLGLRAGHVKLSDFTCRPVYSPPNAAESQVMVCFASTRLRDDVRAHAKNLRGEQRSVGVQIEVPDHLRGRYHTFQTLAYQLKKQHPTLKRNIKLVDSTMDLVMDVKLSDGDDWKSVLYEDASAIVPGTRTRASSLSRNDLARLLPKEQVPDDTQNEAEDAEAASGSSMEEDDCIDLTGENTKKQNYSSNVLTFINTNARSLGPKIESLFDCIHEKGVDIACITETWYQSNRLVDEEIKEYADRFSLGAIVRNRGNVAANGRQYGGVALFFRKLTSSFAEFALDNPDNHEVLAALGRVKGIKGNFFCIVAYAPPQPYPTKS